MVKWFRPCVHRILRKLLACLMKNNSPSNVRLPESLLADLRRIAGEHQLRGEKPPIFGDLLLEAWTFYATRANVAHPDLRRIPGEEPAKELHAPEKSHAEDKNVPDSVEDGNMPVIKLHLPQGNVEHVTGEEWRWVRRLLHIVRGERSEAMRPLDTNMDSFVLLTDLLTKGPQDGSESSELPDSPEDLQALMDKLCANEIAIREKLDRVIRSTEAAQRAREDVEADRKRVAPRSKRDPGSATGGGKH